MRALRWLLPLCLLLPLLGCQNTTYVGGKSVSDYVDNIYKNLHEAKTAAGTPSQKVALIMPGGGSEHMIAGTDSFQADCLKQVGATPVGPKGKIFVNVNVEDLLKQDPDV